MRRADDELGNELNEEQSTGGTRHRKKYRFPLFSTAATDAKHWEKKYWLAHSNDGKVKLAEDSGNLSHFCPVENYVLIYM